MDRVFRSLSGTVRAAMLTWQLLPFSSALGKNTSTYASVTLIAPTGCVGVSGVVGMVDASIQGRL